MWFTRQFLLLFLPVFLTGCLKPVSEIYPDNPAERIIPVYIVSHGWHAGIAIKTNYISSQLPEHSEIPQTEYLKFGWGDARYYSEPDAGFWLLTRAALLPTKSAIHIVGINRSVEDYFLTSTVIKITITEEGADELGNFIKNSLKIENGQPVYYSPGLYTNSSFFESGKIYILPRTSNKWTAQALRATGYPISPFYAFTSGNVIKQAKKDGQVIQDD